MFWLARPPYWRWLAAAAVLATALYLDLTGPPTERYPFVDASVGAGEAVVVEWRDVPRGLLPPHGGTSGIAGRALAAGTPLVDGLLEPAAVVPQDWWAVTVELPADVNAGREVMITTRAPDLQAVGIVVTPPTTSGFGSLSPGLVAFPPDHAPAIANALAERRATVLVRP
jgi:hypothetical protein